MYYLMNMSYIARQKCLSLDSQSETQEINQIPISYCLVGLSVRGFSTMSSPGPQFGGILSKLWRKARVQYSIELSEILTCGFFTHQISQDIGPGCFFLKKFIRGFKLYCSFIAERFYSSQKDQSISQSFLKLK